MRWPTSEHEEKRELCWGGGEETWRRWTKKASVPRKEHATSARVAVSHESIEKRGRDVTRWSEGEVRPRDFSRPWMKHPRRMVPMTA
eukprot:795188-Rhodomonas_salina.4